MRRMMSEELWGVFFEDSGREYLVAVFDDEDEASNDAEERDQQQFESALEMDDEAREVAFEPKWEDFEGMHYVEPVSPRLAADAHDMLARGIAVPVADE
jgi:hypothetical protein